MNRIEILKRELVKNPKTWLITGVSGFIGSNILEELLNLSQKVIGLDNFSTGHKKNLEEVKEVVSEKNWKKFSFIEGDIRDFESCIRATSDVDYVLHQAALGSVPRSIKNPIETNSVNINGFINILEASRISGVKSFTYAASSSTYGDSPILPKVEENIGEPLSPYAVTKLVNEIYAKNYAKVYEFNAIGLRYFNVFGKRQDPFGPYAAVIPKWTAQMINGECVEVNGDGETSRDFCHIDNVIQANILSAMATNAEKNQVYNIAVGDRMTLNELLEGIRLCLEKRGLELNFNLEYKPFRVGDVRHSQASISKAKKNLGYMPTCRVIEGLDKSTDWYIKNL